MQLDKEIENVVRRGVCAGCGACAWAFDGVDMGLSEEGYLRPQIDRRKTGGHSSADAQRFREFCPGVKVVSPDHAGAEIDPVFGPLISVWKGYAADPELRFKGSSGGVITAITAWLADEHSRVSLGVCQSRENASRTVPIAITSREDALRASGSRYAPCSSVAGAGELDSSSAVVGKPCEAAALRQYYSALRRPDDSPLLISFLCAGTPSQHATDSLLEASEVKLEYATRLDYRGDGWPGMFSADDSLGNHVEISYAESWGKHLGRRLQWRCKVCPHGTGDHADISVGDFWETDDKGFPNFTSRDGTSLVLARTARGHELIQRAIREGILCLQPADIRKAWQIQPLQTDRRLVLASRILGSRIGGRVAPRYYGFQLYKGAFRYPIRSVRAVLGSFLRARATIRARSVLSTKDLE